LGTIAADVLTTGLSQMEDIEVVPTMTTLPLSISQGPVGLKTLARETGARIVISGFFSLEAQNIRFRARFTDAKKEQVLRALDPVDGKTEEAALKALRQRVMGALGSIRGLSILEDTAARHIPTYEAYQEFITGYEEFGLDYANAFAHFEKALDLDPEFMNPRLAMGIGYTNQGQYEQAAFHLDKINEKRETHTPWERDYLDWALANLEGNQAQQMHFLRRLERQSPHDSIVNYLIGLVAIEQNRPQVTIETYKKFNLPEQRQNFVSSSWWFGNWARAYHMLGQYKKELKIARRAQELFPDFLTLKSYEVRALAAMGKMGEIERIIEESKTITPRYGSLTGLLYDAAVELRARGYLEESQDYAHKTNEIYRSQLSETESETIRFYLARALIYAGQLEESKALFDSLILANPPDIQYKRILGILEAMMGHREAALQIYRELEGFTGPYLHGEHTYGMACISAWLGEKDQAIELLKKSFANGWGYGDYLLWDISLEPLRECNSFQELIKPKR
jgi:tetratricopeptide (TPR) repeat protein